MADFVTFYGIIDGDEGVHVVDMATGVSVGYAAGDRSGTQNVSFAYDGTSRAVYSARNTAAQEGQLLPEIAMDTAAWIGDFPTHEFGGYRCVSLRVADTPLGHLVFAAIEIAFAGPKQVRVYEYATSNYLGLLPNTPNCFYGAMDIRPDGGLLIVSGISGSPYVRCYDTTDLSELSALSTAPSTNVSGAVFSPDGSYFALFVTTATPQIMLYDATTRAYIRTYTLSATYGNCSGMAFSTDGSKLAVLSSTSSASAQLRVLDTSSSTTLNTISKSFGSTATYGIHHDRSMRWTSDDSLLFCREQVYDATDGYADVSFYDIAPALAVDIYFAQSVEASAFWTNFRSANETIVT